MARPEEAAPDEPTFDLTSSDLPTYPASAEPESEAVDEHEPRYGNPDFLSQFLADEELHRPRRARRHFPAVTVVLLLFLAGVVAVYLNWDRLFGPSAPPAGTPVAAEPAADGRDGSITPVTERAETPPEEAPPTAAAPEFTRVLDISWTRRPGGMKIEIETDGMILQGRYKYFRLEGEKPREVVKLKGVVERYPQSEIKVSGAPVGRIRVGYHANRELHVVLDMLDRTSRLSTVRARGKKLEIFIELGAGPSEPARRGRNRSPTPSRRG